MPERTYSKLRSRGGTAHRAHFRECERTKLQKIVYAEWLDKVPPQAQFVQLRGTVRGEPFNFPSRFSVETSMLSRRRISF